MSEEILKALMQLFAILSKQDDGGQTIHDDYVKEFLLSQISRDRFEFYYEQYIEYKNQEPSPTGDASRTSVKDSVRTLSICKKINKTLSQKQKSIVLVRIAEFVYITEEISQLRLELLKTIGDVFKIEKEEFRSIHAFSAARDNAAVLSDTSFQRYVDRTLYAEAGEDCIQKEGLQGILYFCWVESAGILLFRFRNESNVNLNGLQIKEGKTYVVSDGATIRTPKASIFHSEVLSDLRKRDKVENILFHGSIESYKFPNGKVALRGIEIVEESGTLFGIMGGSGAGKTTLLNVLSGLDPTDQVKVTLNGFPVSSSESKANIGYIPQDDLLMEELTVYQNLFFNAKLINASWSKEELDQRVEKVLRDLGLYEIRNIQVGSPLNKKISGGQRKRLNIALELLREPLVLFVDEPTSGLSSKDSENVMNLLKQLAQTGKLIFVVIHQPSSEIYKLFDKMFILDVGGFPVYYGNPIEAVIYFKTLTHQINQEIGECGTCGNVNPEQIFDTLEDKAIDDFGNYTQTRKISPEQWNEFFKERIVPPVSDTSKPLEKLTSVRIPGRIRQFAIFFKRDLLSRLRDKQYVLIAILEAPVLAALLSFIIRSSSNGGKSYTFASNQNIPAYIFMLVIVALFVGLSISAEEIFKDQKIIKREKFLRLSRVSYLKSKFTYLMILSLLQSFLLCAVGNSIIGLQDNFLYYWILIFSVFVFGNVLGLLLSSSFKSIVTIYVIIPLIVIPQMILGGAMFKFENLNPSVGGGNTVPVISKGMVSNWAYEAAMVKQFTSNAYESRIYEYEQLISEYNYRTSYLLPYLEDLLTNESASAASDTVTNTLRFEFSRRYLPEEKKRKIEKLSVEEAQVLVEELKEFYQDRQNELSRLKDEHLMVLEEKLGNDQLAAEKNGSDNEDISEIVQNTTTKNRYFVQNNTVFQNYDFVFMRDHLDPAFQLKGNLMYVPVKAAFGQTIPTFWYNVIVIWLFIFATFIALYFDILKRIMEIKLFKRN
ncbi:MAG: hypothetical protein RIT43_2500 [Bacteroidota bacterium]|jgi:ABC-type multidrug transport system ATPase subunit